MNINQVCCLDVLVNNYNIPYNVMKDEGKKCHLRLSRVGVLIFKLRKSIHLEARHFLTRHRKHDDRKLVDRKLCKCKTQMLISVNQVKHLPGVCWTMVNMHDSEVNLQRTSMHCHLFYIANGILYKTFYIGYSMN